MKYLLLLTFFSFYTSILLFSQSPFGTPIEGDYGKEFIINNYVDWGIVGFPSDHECLSKTYGGHQGTDFQIRNIALMDSGVYVLAAEAGTVTAIQDGLFDREKMIDIEKGFGNFIAINHFNGFQTYYAHLKKESLLVSVGDTVSIGQRIAQVGSSGNSSDPHLHFEIWYDSTFIFDPFKGTCGNPTTLWSDPIPYDSSFFVWTSGTSNYLLDLDTVREEPIQIDTFYTFDDAISYWNIMAGLRAGDHLDIEWYEPGGQLWFNFNFPIDRDWWYYYFWFYIDVSLGNDGLWNVILKRNGVEVDSRKFVLQTVLSLFEFENNTDNFTVYYTEYEVIIDSKMENHTTHSINIHDINGRLTEDFKSVTLPLEINNSKYLPGVYILKIKTSDEYYTKKIILH